MTYQPRYFEDGSNLESNLLMAKILAPYTVYKDNKYGKILIKTPSSYHRYEAEKLYQAELISSKYWGALDETELLELMMEYELWSVEKEAELDARTKDIEECKVKLFENYFNGNARIEIQKLLQKHKDEVGKLYGERHAYDAFSCLSIAMAYKNRYLLASSLYHKDGTQVFDDDEFLNSESFELIQNIILFTSENRCLESDIRFLARSDTWRAIWSCKRSGSPVLGSSVLDWSDEQKTLVAWTLLYDSVYEHPESPPQVVIDDDDALDGWLIKERRTQKLEDNKKQAEKLIGNSKIANSDEVYIIAKNKEEVDAINSLNNPVAQALKRQKLNLVKKKGEVNELDMPDVRQRLMTEAANKISERMKGKTK